MLLRRITPAEVSPISLAEAFEHLRQPDPIETPVVEAMLASSVELVSGMAGRVLAQETWAASYPYLQGMVRLPKSPVIAVTGITYYDEFDVQQTLDLADFYVFPDQDYTLIRPKNTKVWPGGMDREDRITITFTVGYTALPTSLRAAVLLTLGHLFMNRESVVIGDRGSELPMGVYDLVAVHRLGWAAG